MTLSLGYQSGISNQDARLEIALLNLFQAVFLIEHVDLQKHRVGALNQLVDQIDKGASNVALSEVVIVNLLPQVHQLIMQEFGSIDASIFDRILREIDLPTLEPWSPLQALVDATTV